MRSPPLVQGEARSQSWLVLMPNDERRLSFLDGMRGLAAVQVVILHYCAAFLPGMGTQNVALSRYGWERLWLNPPLYFFIDGTFAVYIFFAISGFVLTLAYDRRAMHPALAILQRLVRLGGPMVVALAIGACLLALLPAAHEQAAAITGSAPWLGALMHAPLTQREVLLQSVASGMIVGYDETTLFDPALMKHLGSISIYRSLDSPLWTLHVEFWGSVLIVILSAIRRRLPGRLYSVVAALATALFFRHALLAFMVGHLFALVYASRPWGRAAGSFTVGAIGAGCIVLGIFACTSPAWPWVVALFAYSGPLRIYGPEHLQNLYAAVLLFTGVMLSPRLWHVLDGKIPQWLGHISFGLYLVHFPVLFTVSSAVFVALQGHARYAEAALAAAVVGVPLSLLAASIFSRCVDVPFVRLARRFRSRSLTINAHEVVPSEIH